MTPPLHRLHAVPASGRGGCSLDVGQGNLPDGTALHGVRWRPEAAENRLEARAMAYRLALCWNLCDGWTTEDLDAGVLAEADAAAMDLARMCVEFAGAPPELHRAAERYLNAQRTRDARIDMKDGRPADCDRCYPVEPRRAQPCEEPTKADRQLPLF